jgi:hypothetical protein
MEFCRVVKCLASYIVQTFGSQMAVRLSALRAGSASGTHFCKNMPRFCQSVHCIDQCQSEPMRLKQLVHTSYTDGGLVAMCEVIFSMA